jgi:hypothetical protein
MDGRYQVARAKKVSKTLFRQPGTGTTIDGQHKKNSIAVRKSVDTLFCFSRLPSPFGVYARQTAVSICLHGGDLEQEQQ